MGRQRNMPRMKQDNSPEEDLNVMEARNLSDIEFRVIHWKE